MLPIDTPFYRAQAALSRIPGVRGVGLAYKQVGGFITSKVAFIVVVDKKQQRNELPASELVPSWFEGVPTDIWEPLRSFPVTTNLLSSGVPIESNRGSPGTMCCLANRGSGSSVEQFILTAHHVLYEQPEDSGPGGDVGSPDISCCWICATGKVAEITDGIGINNLDCAIAKLNGKRPAGQRIPGLGPTLADPKGQNSDLLVGVAPLKQVEQGLMSPVALDEHVRKVGAVTNLTGGRIFALDLPLPKDVGVPAMEHQIVVSPLQDEGVKRADGKFHFCDFGDSGAPVMNDHNEIVGLLHRAPGFGPPEPGFPVPQPWWGRGGAFTDIHKIMTGLNITIPPSKTGAGAQQARAVMPGTGIYRMPKLTTGEHAQRDAIETIKVQLRLFPLGRRLVAFVETHQPEIAQLVNHDRRVTVAWHRAHGPNFLAKLLRDVETTDAPIPRQMDGMKIEDSLAALHAILVVRGSESLCADMAVLWPVVRDILPRSPTIRAFVDNLRGATAHV